jgi:hypothetical protein
MDPTPVYCPHLACSARGQTGQGNIGLHSRTPQRCIWRPCRNTFTETKGTVFYRLRTSADTVTLVVTLMARGCPLQAMVVAFGDDARMVAAWWARASRQGQAVQAYRVEHPRDLGPGQADEIRVKTPGGIVWMALALMRRTRWWLAGEVSRHRDLSLIRRLIERVRRCAAPRPLMCCPDGWCSSSRALRATCRAPLHMGTHGRPRRRPWRNLCIAQVVKRDVQPRVVEVERRLIEGSPTRVETRRRRNVCTPHARLRCHGGATTPAMATRITDPCWTVHELRSFHIPRPRWMPPKTRGRPSRELQCLIEQ